jgi:hypothetical protein
MNVTLEAKRRLIGDIDLECVSVSMETQNKEEIPR